MIRFCTADLTCIISRDIYECSRTHLKISPITRWRDGMLIVKEMNQVHDPIRQAGYLRQSLATDKMRIGLFLGAGCPVSIEIRAAQRADGRDPQDTLGTCAQVG